MNARLGFGARRRLAVSYEKTEGSADALVVNNASTWYFCRGTSAEGFTAAR